MREFVLTQAAGRPATRGLEGLFTWLRNWRSRREFAKLSHLSETQLRDIGLSRDELGRLARLPLTVDPVWEAERLRLLNARQRTG